MGDERELVPRVKRGDTVLWRGTMGAQAPRLAVVERVEVAVVQTAAGPSGDEVESVPWYFKSGCTPTCSRPGRCVVLHVKPQDGGARQWAYFAQVEPAPRLEVCPYCGGKMREVTSTTGEVLRLSCGHGWRLRVPVDPLRPARHSERPGPGE